MATWPLGIDNQNQSVPLQTWNSYVQRHKARISLRGITNHDIIQCDELISSTVLVENQKQILKNSVSQLLLSTDSVMN